MRPSVTNTIEQDNLIVRKYNYKYVLGICALFFVLLVARGISDSFFYAFAAVSSVLFIVSNSGHCISFLFFLLPFATILKQDVGGMSFFTVLFFLVILKLTIKLHKISVWLVVSLAVLSLYSLAFSGFSELSTIITMVSGILLLYYLRNEKLDTDINMTVIVYSIGIVLSSILALLKPTLPVVDLFITESMLKLKGTEYASRFSGLQGNPNYYTLDITIALAAIVVLLYNNRNTKIHTIFLVTLSVFGLMSVSKSFLITWIFLIICWLFISIKQGVRKTVKFIIVAIVGAMVIYFFAYEYINTYLYRLLGDSAGTLESITTGRTEIWASYFNEILDNIKILFFGNGLNTISETIGMGTHNTYLETLFCLGIIGTIIMLVSLRFSIGKIELNQGVWIPILVLMIRMFALGMLTYDNLWFYFAVISMLTREIKQINAIEQAMLGD